ncbi:ComF family protein [Sinomicrobium soli]|uniref:ComF family protein n=1 Tax=Sinomicrobium sp. N-1-3-6 TaxID=2219864 RepID=UPI001374A9D7|nr:ComF family protein [Sinomicrobium sp. N-1-3-6]
MRFTTVFSDIFNLLFPLSCPGCTSHLSAGEQVLCTSCRHCIPETTYHLQEENPVVRLFYGRVRIAFATSFLLFRKEGITQQLIHHLKYRNRPDIGLFLGKWYGHLLRESPFLHTVDLVVPVPLHPKKYRRRGYNQVSAFARCLADALHARYCDTLLVKKDNPRAQAFRGKADRWEETENLFGIRPGQDIGNCHILLVDDVVTTGATLEHCVLAFQKSGNVKVSIATMAFTI